MSGCAEYKILVSDVYLQNLEQIVKSHYSTNPKGRQQFEALIEVFWQQLAADPRNIVGASPEPWPPGKTSSKQGFDFWKLRFQMPSLHGSARKGRLMYLVHDTTCSVTLNSLYTHVEFNTRPPDQDIRDELRRCIDSVREQF